MVSKTSLKSVQDILNLRVSITIINRKPINQGNNIRIARKYIKLLKLGCIKVRQPMEMGQINNVTIERTSTGKYFAVFTVALLVLEIVSLISIFVVFLF